MADYDVTVRADQPRLPWFGTITLLVAVMITALVRPLMPHGIVEFALRLANRPLSLDMGHGRSLRFVQERTLKAGCQVSDLAWSPDGQVLVTACPRQLQAWTLNGRAIGKCPAEWPWFQHMQVLADPFRLAYWSGGAGVRHPILTVCDVQADTPSDLPLQQNGLDEFAIDQGNEKIAVTHVSRQDWDLRVFSLGRMEFTHTLQIPTAARALRWLPGSRALLLGGYDGVLRRADITTGDVQELARPYTTVFPSGGSDSAMVDGLVLSPDGRSVAIFKTSGGISPDPATGKVDVLAGRKWEETLGTTVEIRSVDDGRLLDRMPGPETQVRDLVWDPSNRFIAVASQDALIVWQPQSDRIVMRTFGDRGIAHRLSITSDGARLAVTTATGARIYRIEAM